MQQLLDLWNAMDGRKRLIVGTATLIVFAGVLMLSRMAAQPSMALLYSGLDPDAAGEVISTLDAQSAPYEVRGNAIYVEEGSRDRLRLSLAGDGLPKTGGAGYELLDTLSGFGTTSQMFDVAYIRAKEGELARTILANPQVRSARVHIAKPQQTAFRKTSPTKASVSLRGAGGFIAPETANAIRYLVASAVAGLRPGDVSVIDADQGIVLSGKENAAPGRAGSDIAALLKGNVERLMEARTGAGNSVVEVSVEILSDEEVITERELDPESRVVISTETSESSNSASNQSPGAVTVASNLPTGDAEGGDAQSNSQGNDTREIVNYEVSETTREVRRLPGGIKRISVAVLVGGTTGIDETGTEVTTPRSSEELETLEALVKSAVGFDAARGDLVTIRSMAFEPVAPNPDMAPEGWALPRGLDLMSLIQLAVTATVILALAMLVIRPILLSAARASPAEGPDLLPDPLGSDIAPPGLTGEIDISPGMMMTPQISPLDGFMEADLTGAGLEDDPVARLRNLIEQRQDETVEILKSWIEAPEETTP